MWSVHTCLLKKNLTFTNKTAREDTNSLAFTTVSVSLAPLHFMMFALIRIGGKKKTGSESSHLHNSSKLDCSPVEKRGDQMEFNVKCMFVPGNLFTENVTFALSARSI